jgi:type IV secretion system protein VirB9
VLKVICATRPTNGVIVTNQRFYLVELHESATARPHYSVSFQSPAGSTAAEQSSVPAGQPQTYVISAATKDAQIQPVNVYDDGRRTFFTFSPDAPIPSIYRADAQGREYIVNGRTDGTRVTVGSRSDRWVIRYGDEYICVQSGRITNG